MAPSDHTFGRDKPLAETFGQAGIEHGELPPGFADMGYLDDEDYGKPQIVSGPPAPKV